MAAFRDSRAEFRRLPVAGTATASCAEFAASDGCDCIVPGLYPGRRNRPLRRAVVPRSPLRRISVGNPGARAYCSAMAPPPVLPGLIYRAGCGAAFLVRTAPAGPDVVCGVQ